MKRALLVLSIAVALADLGVVVARTQHRPRSRVAPSLQATFDDALRRHDYRHAYSLTDLPFLKITGGSSAVTLAHFTAFARAHGLGPLTVEQGLVHIPTTNLHVTATTGPLPGLSVDGVRVSLISQRIKAGRVAAAAWRYTYAIVAISGPHSLVVGSGPVTAPISVNVAARGDTTPVTLALQASSLGNSRTTAALRAIVGTCPSNLCVLAPCAGRGIEYVLDAWGIGTPPIVARALVGDRLIAPMPPDGWSIAITFADQGQPPGLSGKEQTKQLRARYVFGFVGRAHPLLLDRCWVAD